jgi:hypothetical protein
LASSALKRKHSRPAEVCLLAQASLSQPGSGFEPGCRVSARAALPSKLMILVEEQTRIESSGVIAERSHSRRL